MKKLLLGLCMQLAIFPAWAQGFRPSAYPLITDDPYFSIWSFSDSLNASPTRHWTGVEQSLQGMIRIDGIAYNFMGQPMPSYSTVLDLSGNQGMWRYTFNKPSGSWSQLSYNDDSWKLTKGAFSSDSDAPNHWESHDIWVRRKFDLSGSLPKNLQVLLHHDDNVEVYINGVLAVKTQGWNDRARMYPILPEAMQALKAGTNVLAIHCENTEGGAYLDAGLVNEWPASVHLPLAQQDNVAITATQTLYTFQAGGVRLKVRFTDPRLPKNLYVYSRPAAYLTLEAEAIDGKHHKVQLLVNAAGNLAVNSAFQSIQWKRWSTSDLNVMQVGTVSQHVLGTSGDNVRIDWGYLYLAAGKSPHTQTAMVSSDAAIRAFEASGTLPALDDVNMPRPANNEPITLNALYKLGEVGAMSKSVHLILAYDDKSSIEFFHQPLKAYWKLKWPTAKDMIESAAHDYSSMIQSCDAFDRHVAETTQKAGGAEYAKLCELAYRQAMAACKLAAGPSKVPMLFTKENFSNGDISTVDVIYPTAPVMLLYNPILMEGLMNPVFYYAEHEGWDKPYSPHDLGTYPIANGRKVEEAMPIEESGNMLILAAALARAEGTAAYAGKHWNVLSKWAEFLLKNGMDPENQLTTDDFAGRSAHNANLSVKAIVALACYGKLAEKLGHKQLGRQYMDSARLMAAKWTHLAWENGHYKLTFDRPGTWSQKYNLIWDKVLDLHVFPDSVAKQELAYYLTKQNRYGLPLDSRATYSKSDWICWTAALASSKTTFMQFIHPLYLYVTQTPSRVPMSDWFQTTTAKQVGFQARSVVGGYFMQALNRSWNPKPAASR